MHCFPQHALYLAACLSQTYRHSLSFLFVRSTHVYSRNTLAFVLVQESLMSPIFKVQNPNHSRHGLLHKIYILGYLTGGILHEGHNHKRSWKCIKSHLVASSRARRWCSTLCCRAPIPQTYQELQPIGVSCVTPCWGMSASRIRASAASVVEEQTVFIFSAFRKLPTTTDGCIAA